MQHDLKETPTQVFSGEICEMFYNTYFEEHLRTTASARPRIYKNPRSLTFVETSFSVQ